MRRISVGVGFRYLMDSVAVGDGAPERPSSLAAYYATSGTPPGVFLGSGLSALAGGRGVEKGSVVTEEHLYNMLSLCCDPVTREPVGRCSNLNSKLAPVAGFDLTFSVSKSVSVAWALADDETRQVIFDCHRRAVDYLVTYRTATDRQSCPGARHQPFTRDVFGDSCIEPNPHLGLLSCANGALPKWEPRG